MDSGSPSSESGSDMRFTFPNNPGVIPNKIPGVLSDEEFESLLKAVQLLRISQLRYIVQKFAIPASGNKSKLLTLVLSIFNSIRYDPVLITIFQEISNLLSQQNPAFTNPLNEITQLDMTSLDTSFLTSQFPFFSIVPESIIMGPLKISIGQSQGNFSFLTPQMMTPMVFDFLIQGRNRDSFSIEGTINGYPFEVSEDDPFPRPIDITSLLAPPMSFNNLSIKCIRCNVPMMLCVRRYSTIGAQELSNNACGRIVDFTKESPIMKGTNCSHSNGFFIHQFFSEALATGRWNCPICQMNISPDKLVMCSPEYEPYYQQSADIFKFDQLDWENL